MDLLVKANSVKNTVDVVAKGYLGCSADCGCDADHYVYPCVLAE